MTEWLIAKNNASSALASAMDAETDTLRVRAGEGSRFPDSFPFRVTVNDEILEVVERSGDLFTVLRGREGTLPAAHAVNSSVRLNLTAGTIAQLQSAIDLLDEVKIAKTLAQARGDILCGAGAGVPARLPAGNDGQLLQADSTQPLGLRWGSIVGVKMTSGLYTGDGTQNRAVPHGLGIVPKLVLVQMWKNTNLYSTYLQIPDIGRFIQIGGSNTGTVTPMDAVNIYVGDSSYAVNSSSYNYRWYALG